jgi:hypothetical protein
MASPDSHRARGRELSPIATARASGIAAQPGPIRKRSALRIVRFDQPAKKLLVSQLIGF